MPRRRSAIAILLVLAATAGACARSVDVADSGDVEVVSPEWVTEGLAQARKARAKDIERAELPDTPAPVPVSTPSYQLPPQSEFTAALSALGLDATAAACIYSSINGTPLAETVGRLLTSATNPLAVATDPGAASLAAGVDEGTQKQLLVALAPCIDTNTLLTVLNAVSGGALGGAGSVSALLTSAMSSMGSLRGIDPTALARAAGVNLSPAQLAALTQALAAAQAAGNVDTSKIDFSKIDVSNLSQQEIIALMAALLKGLTPEQAAQLRAVAAIDLKSLDLDIDASKLSNEEAGALFVLLLPFISAGVAPPGNTPPPGHDPGQIYIPPGTDLSAINPLNFVTRDNMILGLGREYGIPPAQAGCIYDRVRLIDPRLIGEAYLGRSEQGAAQLALAFVSCVVAA